MRASSVASSSVPVARSKIAPEIVGAPDQISRLPHEFVLTDRHRPVPFPRAYRVRRVPSSHVMTASVTIDEAIATASPILA